MEKKGSDGGGEMDYQKLSNHELAHIVRDRLPDVDAIEITDFNRQTTIAFLNFYSRDPQTPDSPSKPYALRKSQSK
jgi:hypothetical protein